MRDGNTVRLHECAHDLANSSARRTTTEQPSAHDDSATPQDGVRAYRPIALRESRRTQRKQPTVPGRRADLPQDRAHNRWAPQTGPPPHRSPSRALGDEGGYVAQTPAARVRIGLLELGTFGCRQTRLLPLYAKVAYIMRITSDVEPFASRSKATDASYGSGGWASSSSAAVPSGSSAWGSWRSRWWGARRRRGYGPLVLGAGAAAALWSGEHLVGSEGLALAGAGLLIAASLWNAWPRRAVPAPVVLRRAHAPSAADVSP